MRKHKKIAKSACFYGTLILYLKYCVLQKIKHVLFFLESPLGDAETSTKDLTFNTYEEVLNHGNRTQV